jgi:hypothetical protein
VIRLSPKILPWSEPKLLSPQPFQSLPDGISPDSHRLNAVTVFRVLCSLGPQPRLVKYLS